MSDTTSQSAAEELRALSPEHVLVLCVANSALGQMEEERLQASRDVRDELRRRLTAVFAR